MFQRFIHRLLLRRHFWRYATFSEVAEIYMSRTIRLFALRLIMVFTSIYLLQEGYNVLFLTLFWAAYALLKVFFAWPSAQIIARFGPKHGTLVSNVLSAISMVFLPLVGLYGIWPLIAWSVLQGASACLYDLSYLVDFSKVKNAEHAGKEIAFMNIFEKVASGVGPVIGGLLAFLVGPQVVMIITSILFLLAALPLFKTGEPVATHQKLDFSGFPWRTTWRSLTAEIAIGFDAYASGTVWTFFMAIIVFAGDSGEVYAKIGLLSSVTLFAALAASYIFGKLIDRRRGLELLRIGTFFDAFTHVMRAFVSTPVSVVFANIMNEGATTAYSMAFTRGMFDTADMTGKRIVYLFLIEVMMNVGYVLAALALALVIVIAQSEEMGLRIFFVVTALVTLLIATPRFALYRK